MGSGPAGTRVDVFSGRTPERDFLPFDFARTTELRRI